MLYKSILLLVIVAVAAYLIGTVNFSKIIAWHARRKDITQVGSKNPGTMNMLRSFGFGLALLTFVAEVVKAGLTCLLLKILFEHFQVWGGGDFVYYLAGFFIMIGYNFPVWTKFKGGKGVACFAGIFIFSPIWYISLGWFVICFIMFLFIDYPFIISLTYTGGLTLATILFVWLTGFYSLFVCIYITAMVGVLYLLTLYKHRANMVRLIHGNENKIDFRGKLKKIFVHNKGERVIDEEYVENSPEKEIVVEEKVDDKKDENMGEDRDKNS